MAGDIVLRLENVDAFYGPIHALRGVSLTVRSGQVVTLLGANGAGKSTTLRVISGLVACASGRIEFLSRDITRSAAHLTPHLGLIHVPEGRRIFKGMTVRENLELGSFTLADEAERQSRLARVFSTFPVLEMRQHGDASQRSGGEQQMLAIGRALMAGPRLVLLDEPIAGVNPTLAAEIAAHLRALCAEGVTFLVIEHHMDLIARLCDPVVVMAEGRRLVEGSFAAIAADAAVQDAYMGRRRWH
ncbi:MAG: ABC transporter ATP-binding protein [Rhodanobacteraceae bacterium]